MDFNKIGTLLENMQDGSALRRQTVLARFRSAGEDGTDLSSIVAPHLKPHIVDMLHTMPAEQFAGVAKTIMGLHKAGHNAGGTDIDPTTARNLDLHPAELSRMNKVAAQDAAGEAQDAKTLQSELGKETENMRADVGAAVTDIEGNQVVAPSMPKFQPLKTGQGPAALDSRGIVSGGGVGGTAKVHPNMKGVIPPTVSGENREAIRATVRSGEDVVHRPSAHRTGGFPPLSPGDVTANYLTALHGKHMRAKFGGVVNPEERVKTELKHATEKEIRMHGEHIAGKPYVGPKYVGEPGGGGRQTTVPTAPSEGDVQALSDAQAAKRKEISADPDQEFDPANDPIRADRFARRQEQAHAPTKPRGVSLGKHTENAILRSLDASARRSVVQRQAQNTQLEAEHKDIMHRKTAIVPYTGKPAK